MLKIKRLPNKVEIVQVKFMSINGNRFRVPDDMGSMLNDLCETDYFDTIIINDIKLAKILKEAGLINQTNKGGYYATELLKKHINKISNELYKIMPNIKIKRKTRF